MVNTAASPSSDLPETTVVLPSLGNRQELQCYNQLIMTPEERWARIEQRHEALAQSLELLSIAQQATERSLQKTERTLRRAIHLAVVEARQERKRRHELQWHADEKITQLAAAQLITEEKLQRLEQSIQRLADRQSGNGNPPIH